MPRVGSRGSSSLGNSAGSQFAVLPTRERAHSASKSANTARLFVGYSFQYLNRVARLGDVLNRREREPPFTDFWIQSFNLGFELRY